TRHRALALELFGHGPGGVGRNVESDADGATGRRINRGVDTDHLALRVEGRPAGVALVHWGIDLQIVVIGSRADVTPAGGDDPGRHGTAEAEGITHGQHPVTDARG